MDDLTAYKAGISHLQTLSSRFPRGAGPADAIRRKCVDCMGGGHADIAECTSVTCPLWPYREGRNPFHARAKNG